jgi:hypothetical protein
VKVCCVPLELNHPSISHENLYFSRYPTGVKLERAIWPISPRSITHPASAFPSFIFCVPSPFLSPSPSLHPHGTSCGQRPSGWRESQPTDELTLRPSLPCNAVQTVLCVASSVGAAAPLRLLSQAHDVSLEISRHRRWNNLANDFDRSKHSTLVNQQEIVPVDISHIPQEVWELVLCEVISITPDPFDGSQELSFIDSSPVSDRYTA